MRGLTLLMPLLVAAPSVAAAEIQPSTLQGSALTQRVQGVRQGEPPCDGDFHLRRSFYFGPNTGMQDLAVGADGDVWALGYNGPSGNLEPVLIHRSEERWNRIEVPEGGHRLTALDVDELGRLWVAGYESAEDGNESGVLWRFDGFQWERVTVPHFQFGSFLWSISVLSSVDVWAVGNYESEIDHDEETLTLHWDGETVTHVDSPAPGYIAELWDVDANASGVWTVGASNRRPLALTWDGSEWKEERFPTNEGFNPAAVSVDANGTVWTAGYSDGSPYRAKIFRRDSNEWVKERVPNPKRHDFLHAIDVSGDLGWAIGDTRGEPKKTFALRRTGSRWHRVRAAQPGLSGSLSAIEIAPDGTAWAVGRFYPGGGNGPRAMVQTACI